MLPLGMLNSFFCNWSSIVQNWILTKCWSIPGDAYHIWSTETATWNSEFSPSFPCSSHNDDCSALYPGKSLTQPRSCIVYKLQYTKNVKTSQTNHMLYHLSDVRDRNSEYATCSFLFPVLWCSSSLTQYKWIVCFNWQITLNSMHQRFGPDWKKFWIPVFDCRIWISVNIWKIV